MRPLLFLPAVLALNARQPGRMLLSNVTLKRAVMGAYALGLNRVVGGPDWIKAERWVIEADHPAGDSELMQTLQTLLADCFQLKVHRESRPMNACVLEVAKRGHKLQPSTAEAARPNNGRGAFEAVRMTMPRFAEVLSRQTGLPVVDSAARPSAN